MAAKIAKAFAKETAAEIAARLRLMIHKKPSGILLDDTHEARISELEQLTARRARLPSCSVRSELRDAIIRQLREA